MIVIRDILESSSSFNALFRALRTLGVISLSFLTLISGTGVGLAQEPGGKKINVEYDAQKDITKITLNPMILVSRKYEELRLGAMTSYQGKLKVEPKEAALIFVSLSAADVSKYESARRLTILADGQQLFVGETQWSKQTQNGVFMESMAAVIPFDIFLRASRAKEVTMKLGLTTVKLSPEHITMLRAAASYMME